MVLCESCNLHDEYELVQCDLLRPAPVEQVGIRDIPLRFCGC